jgi:hypothetical protein
MLVFHVGSYVIHKKLEELGSGEIVKLDETGMRIRFASGERLFSEALVAPHLEVTREAPVLPLSAVTARKRSSKARKA